MRRMAGFRRANWVFVRMISRRDRKVTEIVSNGNQIGRNYGQASAARERKADAAAQAGGGRPWGGGAFRAAGVHWGPRAAGVPCPE